MIYIVIYIYIYIYYIQLLYVYIYICIYIIYIYNSIGTTKALAEIGGPGRVFNVDPAWSSCVSTSRCAASAAACAAAAS